MAQKEYLTVAGMNYKIDLVGAKQGCFQLGNERQQR